MRHNTYNINNDMHIYARYVILTKHSMWLPDDGFMWTETCWSSFYNFNYFNILRILQFVCISWKIKCLVAHLSWREYFEAVIGIGMSDPSRHERKYRKVQYFREFNWNYYCCL